MAEVTNELMLEILKSLQHDMRQVKMSVGEVKQELSAIRLSQTAMQTDLHNIYGMLYRHDDRLDRIERRLELRELAEPQRPYQPE